MCDCNGRAQLWENNKSFGCPVHHWEPTNRLAKSTIVLYSNLTWLSACVTISKYVSLECICLCSPSLAFFSRSTLAFTFGKLSTRTLPLGWDDPSDSVDLNQTLVAIFHQAARGTATRCAEVPQTVPLVTINSENLRRTLRYEMHDNYSNI